MLGCCSKYKECSDSGICLQKGEMYQGCMYRQNLEQGKTFYRDRRNIEMSNLEQKLQQKNETVHQSALQQKQQTAVEWVNSPEISSMIAQALPKHITKDRILSVVAMAFRKNPKLQQCSKNSLLAAIITASQLGLELNTPLGHACVIPFENKRFVNGEWKKVLEAEFQLEYQGLIDLAYRTGEYETIYAEEVDSSDKFEMELGLNKRLIHIPNDEPSGKIKGYYAVYRLKNGGYDFKYQSVKQIEAWAEKYSPGYRQLQKDLAAKKDPKNNAWHTSFDQMAKKTVLKMLLKYAPKSIELARQLILDETVKDTIEEDMSLVPNVIEYESETIADVDFTVQESEPETDPEDVKKNYEQLKEKAKSKTQEIKETIVPQKEAPVKTSDPMQYDPAEEIARAQNELDCKRIHILISEFRKYQPYPDEQYRKELNAMFGVGSSKELTHKQAEEFKKVLKEYISAAKAETKPGDIEIVEGIFDKPKTKHKDFVGDARKDMLRRTYESGQPLTPKEFVEIGININTVPPEMIKRNSWENVSIDEQPPFMQQQE